MTKTYYFTERFSERSVVCEQSPVYGAKDNGGTSVRVQIGGSAPAKTFGSYVSDEHIICSLGEAKLQMAPRLVNLEKNRKMLAQVPHFVKEDLAVVFYCGLFEREPDGFIENPNYRTAVIDYSDLVRWGMSRENLRDLCLLQGKEHLPYTFERIEDVIGLENAPMMDSAPFLYVLSNTQALYGASAVLYPGVLKEIADKLGEDFYLLPSSVHEMLVMPKSHVREIGVLRSVIREINEYEMDPKDVLSDQVYLYSRERDDFAIATEDSIHRNIG